ncbi:MAG: DNA-binding protein [Alphaproteobacteria bacterium]
MSEEIEAYRVSEFCKRYVLSKATFYREVAAKRLHIIKRGRTTLILRAEAERWFQSLCQSQPQQMA